MFSACLAWHLQTHLFPPEGFKGFAKGLRYVMFGRRIASGLWIYIPTFKQGAMNSNSCIEIWTLLSTWMCPNQWQAYLIWYLPCYPSITLRRIFLFISKFSLIYWHHELNRRQFGNHLSDLLHSHEKQLHCFSEDCLMHAKPDIYLILN